MNHKFSICDTVFCKFRGKWNIGTVEYIRRRGLELSYGIVINGAKHIQEKKECELKTTLKLDENGKII